MTTRVLLVLSAAAALSLSASGCRGNGGGGSGGAPPCSFPRSQTLSEPCCTEHGADACGASLFCAAFDGRTQPTCYAERSRPDGAECTANLQCLSAACNVGVQRCQSLPGQPCTQEVGCAPAPAGTAYVCNPVAELGLPANSCAPADPANGGLCATDDGCTSHRCVNGHCSSGESGSECADAADCAASAPLCVGNQCSAGTVGSACESPGDCASSASFCVKGACSSGKAGSPCSTSADCAPSAPHCVAGACHAGTNGDPCVTKADCAPSHPLCVGGHCTGLVALGGSCTASSDCAQLAPGTDHGGAKVICDAGECGIAPGQPCGWSDDTCTAGHSCQPSPGGNCLDGTNASCSGELCCGANNQCNWVCYNGQSCQ